MNFGDMDQHITARDTRLEHSVDAAQHKFGKGRVHS